MNNVSYIHEVMNDVAIVLAPLKSRLKSERRFIDALLHIFSSVTDFRQQLKVIYKLENILCICLLIAMRGKFTSFYHAGLFIKVRTDYFKNLGLIEGDKIPSHDTLRRIFLYIDADELRDCMLNRIRDMLDKITAAVQESGNKVRLLSGDGKTFNGSGRTDGTRNVNVFNVLDASGSLCLASIPLEDKDSEIPTFKRLLKKYKLKNTMVTGDALHCQIDTMDIIHSRGGDFTFTVKDNQPGKKQHIIDVLKFNAAKCKLVSYNNCDYEIFVIDYELTEEDFPHAAAYVRMISHKRAAQQDYNPTAQYFVTSSPNIRLIVEAIDSRWTIECCFHWWKDDFLKEDDCTFMDKNAIKVMATFNNIAFSLYRIASAIFDDSCMAETRLRFEECPEKMLAKLVPLLEKQNLTMLIKQNMRGRKKTT
ncbi:ISAs1 family transposase [uncultured Succinatimonas sp.]|uniref:ISAs1 family transposase n=1 Tax=uncultured Succinatimonas sp. TaxID=1262973 RepID=UPI0025D824EC|nr:ISAs1 family transposase [uncultured Succinatimonas sp.]